jgi:hypothetical protein
LSAVPRLGQRPGAGRGAEPVPGVDHGDCPDQLGQLGLGESRGGLVVDRVGHRALAQPSHRLGQRERRPLAGGEEGRLGPDRQRVEPPLAGRLDIPDIEPAIYQLYSLALYPHLIHAAYGTKLDPELSQKLVTSGVDMFLSYYRYRER